MTDKAIRRILITFMVIGCIGAVSGSIAACYRIAEGDVWMAAFNIVIILINIVNVLWLYLCFKDCTKSTEEVQNRPRLQKSLNAMDDDKFDKMIAELKSSMHKTERGGNDHTN